MTWLPNKPNIAATKAKILKPPPIAIERLLRSKKHEVKKHKPDKQNKTRNAPTFNKASFPKVKEISSETNSKQMPPVMVVNTNIANNDPMR